MEHYVALTQVRHYAGHFLHWLPSGYLKYPELQSVTQVDSFR